VMRNEVCEYMPYTPSKRSGMMGITFLLRTWSWPYGLASISLLKFISEREKFQLQAVQKSNDYCRDRGTGLL